VTSVETDVRTDAEGRRAPTPRPRRSVGALIFKITALLVLDILVIIAVPRMADAGETISIALVIIAAIALNALYLLPGAVPMKFLAPGMVFLLLFLLYPVLYTVYLSFTNFGTGNIVSKDQAIEQILDRSTVSDSESRQFALTVVTDSSGQLAMLLEDEAGTFYLGTASDGVTELAPGEVTFDGDNPEAAGDFTALSLINASSRQDEIVNLEVPSEQGVVKVSTFTTASERNKDIVYDAERDVMIRTSDDQVFFPVEGRYTAPDGQTLSPGWRAFIGGDNYTRIVDNAAIREPFIRTFLWTVSFAVLSVVLTLVMGLGLAMALDDQRLHGRRMYRSLLIIPYAIPSFVTALVWAGLLNTDFGAVNEVLGVNIRWLTDPWMARISVLLVNLWLGFPYMMLVSMGALQAIPGDVLEASKVDGAGPLQRFRLIRFPLLMITLAPLLIASFAFNFNNFNVIYLLTRGGPPVVGSQTPAGHTDILISYTYRLAFEGGRGQDFGFAAAISVVVFLMVATISAISFKRTKAFEELV
jgi:arabinogalactan oligomer/maltooligosaccharide transport system permease protein